MERSSSSSGCLGSNDALDLGQSEALASREGPWVLNGVKVYMQLYVIDADSITYTNTYTYIHIHLMSLSTAIWFFFGIHLIYIGYCFYAVPSLWSNGSMHMWPSMARTSAVGHTLHVYCPSYS